MIGDIDEQLLKKKKEKKKRKKILRLKVAGVSRILIIGNPKKLDKHRWLYHHNHLQIYYSLLTNYSFSFLMQTTLKVGIGGIY